MLDDWAKKISRLNKTRTMIIGASQNLFLTFRKSQNSFRIDSFDMGFSPPSINDSIVIPVKLSLKLSGIICLVKNACFPQMPVRLGLRIDFLIKQIFLQEPQNQAN